MPVEDSLLVVSHIPTPHSRKRILEEMYFTPRALTFDEWRHSPTQVKYMKPLMFYRYRYIALSERFPYSWSYFYIATVVMYVRFRRVQFKQLCDCSMGVMNLLNQTLVHYSLLGCWIRFGGVLVVYSMLPLLVRLATVAMVLWNALRFASYHSFWRLVIESHPCWRSVYLYSCVVRTYSFIHMCHCSWGADTVPVESLCERSTVFYPSDQVQFSVRFC